MSVLLEVTRKQLPFLDWASVLAYPKISNTVLRSLTNAFETIRGLRCTVSAGVQVACINSFCRGLNGSTLKPTMPRSTFELVLNVEFL